MRKIGYNSQRDNFSFAGTFPGWMQCMSTSAWMFLSHYDPSVRAGDDRGLAAYVDDVEATVGRPGIGERVMQKYRWITGRTSMWWLVQQAALQARIPGKKIVFNEHYPIEQLLYTIENGPIIIGTNRMGGLPGGHIILLVDYDRDRRGFIVNDPYGDATGNYLYAHGHNVLYGYDWLLQYIDYGNAEARCIYAV